MFFGPSIIFSTTSEKEEKSDTATRQAASREKYGPKLRKNFQQVDKDNSGYVSIDEMW